MIALGVYRKQVTNKQPKIIIYIYIYILREIEREEDRDLHVYVLILLSSQFYTMTYC